MQIKLNRNQVFYVGIGIVFFFFFLNKLVFICNGKFTKGVVGGGVSWSTNGRYGGTSSAPLIEFKTKGYVISFYGVTNTNIGYGDTVTVIYEKAQPTNAKVFSFVGFWLMSFIWSGATLVLLMSAVYSFIAKNDVIKIEIGKKFGFKKEKNQEIDSNQHSLNQSK